MRSIPTKSHLTSSRLVALLCLLWVGTGMAVNAQGMPAAAESPTHRYADEPWEDLRDALDYSGQPPAPKTKRERSKKGDAADMPDRAWDFRLGEGWSLLMKILFFTILGTLLVFLIYQFLKNSDQSSPTDEGAFAESDQTEALLSLEALVEQLDRTEVDPYIRDAEAKQHYDLAIRLHFLAALKQLHQGGYIRWKKDHTNRVYLQQLYGQAPYTPFRELSYIFEHCWYGRNIPDASTYPQLKQRFTQFSSQLKPLSSS
jgi:hypothetical protein